MSATNVRAGKAYVEIAGEDSELQRVLTRAQGKLRAFSQTLSAAGQGAVTGAVGAALPLAMVGKLFADFDDQMRTVKAVSQSTQQEFERLTATAKKLGATTSFTAVQVAGIMAELGRAGFVAAEVDRMTASVLDLARATGTDAVMSSGIMASTLRQFGLAAEDSTRVADGLTAAANKSFNSVESLGEALKYVGPDAAAANMSLEETLAILGALGNVGKQGSEAGTALRRLITLSGAEAAMWTETFGVKALDAAGNVRPLIDILDEITRSVDGMPTGEKLEKFNKAFGLLGITAATALGKSAGSARELHKQIVEATGVAAKTAKEMDDGVGGTIRKTLSALEGAGIVLGHALSPAITKIGLIAQAVAAWAQQNQWLLGTLGKTILLGGLLTVGVGATFLVVGKLAGGLAILVAGAKLGIGAFVAVKTAVVGFGIAASGALGQVAAAGAALKLSLGIVGFGIVALGVVMSRASGYTAKYSNDIELLTQKNEAARQKDLERFEALQKLGRVDVTNQTQMEQTISTIGLLTDKYGDLGLSVNAVTGKIEGLETAQARLNTAMKESALRDLGMQIQEARNNLNEAEKAYRTETREGSGKGLNPVRLGQQAIDPGNVLGIDNVGSFGDLFRGSSWSALFAQASGNEFDTTKQTERNNRALEFRRLEKKYAEMEKELEPARKQAAAVEEQARKRRELEALVHDGSISQRIYAAAELEQMRQAQAQAEKTKAARTTAFAATADAASKLFSIEEKIATKRRDEYENEIAEIQKVAVERKLLAAQLLRSATGGLAGGGILAQQALGQIDDDTAAQIAEVERRRQVEHEKALAEAEQERFDQEQENNRRLNEQAEKRQQLAEDLATTERDLAIEAARRAVDAATTPEQKKAAESALRDLQQQEANARADRFRQDAIQRMSDSGITPEELVARLDQINRISDSMRQLPELGKQSETGTFSSQGTFSAAAAALLGGGTGYAEQTAKNTERTAKGIDRLVRNLQPGANGVFT